jgi:hypothetical protein
VPKQHLDDANVLLVLQQMGGEGMPHPGLCRIGLLSWRVDIGSSGSWPGNSQPWGSILPWAFASLHQLRSNVSKLGESMA